MYIAGTLAKIACRRKKGNPNPDRQIQGIMKSTEVLNTQHTHMFSCYVHVTERSMDNCLCDKMADLTAVSE